MATRANHGKPGWRELRDEEIAAALDDQAAEWNRRLASCAAWLPGEHPAFVHHAICGLRAAGEPITRATVLDRLAATGRANEARPRAAAGQPEDATDTVSTTKEG